MAHLHERARRRAVPLTSAAAGGDWVECTFLPEGPTFPLVVQPRVDALGLEAWAREHCAWIEERLLRHGALLLRGFAVESLEEFQRFAALSGELLEYTERSSPRSLLSGRVYSSTDHPPDQAIFVHNEHSYACVFPLKILFHCVVAADSGGQTPVADCRRVLARIPARVRERFERLGYLYVRNYGDGFGLTWQAAFQAEDPHAVEAYCRANEIDVEWKSGGRLRTRQRRPAVWRHPRSGEPVWFNHATFFHVSTLEPAVCAALRSNFAEDELPNNTFYGDGAPIEPETLDLLRAAYRAESVAFPWRAGDVLLLDNMLCAHGRAPFGGARRVVVAMADPQDVRRAAGEAS